MFPWQDPGAAIRVAVFGAGGGIGGAFVDELASRPGVAAVYALSRRESGAGSERVIPVTTDILSDTSLAKVAAAIPNELDIVIVATGVLHGASFRPERRLKEVNSDTMLRVFEINAVAPVLIAKHFLPKLRRDARTVFAALSARVGSISDNRLGGWLSYRSSKAALNMALKTIAIEHNRTRGESVVVGLHPGTVDTRLSRPFAANVDPAKLFTPAQSVGYLLAVIDRLSACDSGGVFAWDGLRIDC